MLPRRSVSRGSSRSAPRVLEVVASSSRSEEKKERERK
jgi:hypothetical protein